MKKDRYKLIGREWLNPMKHKDSGAISYSVEQEYGDYISVEFTIWDCSRKITLDFGFDPTKKKAKNMRLAKIDRLISALTKVRNAMAEVGEKDGE